MAQGCLKCLKYTMCVVNFLCFICGISVMGFGIYLTLNFKMIALTPTLAKFGLSNMLLITGIVITCVSFLGFLGALKENRCLLLMFFLLLFFMMLVELIVACVLLMYESNIGEWVSKDLKTGLDNAKKTGNHENTTATLNDWDFIQKTLQCCGLNNFTDWDNKVPNSCCDGGCQSSPQPPYWSKGCLHVVQTLFEDNFLTTGISVIGLCVIEVLGMCFAMTLFCHISRSGLGYKL